MSNDKKSDKKNDREKEQDILNALLSGMTMDEPSESKKIESRTATKVPNFFSRCNLCGYTTQTDERKRCMYCLQLKVIQKSSNY